LAFLPTESEQSASTTIEVSMTSEQRMNMLFWATNAVIAAVILAFAAR
jgi:hypothetical protein